MNKTLETNLEKKQFMEVYFGIYERKIVSRSQNNKQNKQTRTRKAFRTWFKEKATGDRLDGLKTIVNIDN